ncbi:MAG: DUF1232 domain-containing protein [Spirochaetales bacterium]|nr:DUF1232 domain-containing protein [Spirochaetales bacterium]
MLTKIKQKAKALKSEITALYYAYQNPGLPWYSKVIIVFTVGYALSPIDLIPDFIPVLGYLDDLIIFPALIVLSIKLIPKDIMVQSREKALNEPLTLKKNWLFATCFLIIWIAIITVTTISIVKVFIE